MSLYKPAKSPFYSYDFQIHGRRFHGSTKARNKKDAEAIERQLKAQAKADLEQEKRTGTGPLTLDIAAGRYWTEVGQHHANSVNTWRDLERLIGYFGKDKRLDEITDREAAALVAWRRGHHVGGRKMDNDGNPVPLVSPSTVNRTTTSVLRQVFNRAKRTWRYQFPNEPDWGSHWLAEPEEIVRELSDNEGAALDTAIREDYAPWLEFARLTGLRKAETLLRWDNVNFDTGQIRVKGKRGKWVTTPITPAIRAILEPLIGHHNEWVFTYVCQRTRKGKVRGERYPITASGATTEWRRTRARADLEDLRFHDIRHDVATKLLRATGNLRLVQRSLNHANIRTTTKYAHVQDADLSAALEDLAKSRKKSRTSAEDAA